MHAVINPKPGYRIMVTLIELCSVVSCSNLHMINLQTVVKNNDDHNYNIL